MIVEFGNKNVVIEGGKYPWFKCKIECVQYQIDINYKLPL